MNSRQPQEIVRYHKDGSVRARGQVIGRIPTGFWEWFRTDGTRMRSGYFRAGIQVGIWTTYDKNGEVYKITDMKDGKPDAEPTIIDLDEPK